MRLLGHAHRSLDPKGRLMLTPEFREQFLAESPDGRLVLTIYQGQVIGITPAQWDAFVAELEKPASPEDAVGMLRRLSGRPHDVLTGVCLLHGSQQWRAVESTRVVFSPLSEEEVSAYCASGEPMDKAGAYAIQGLASKFIERVEGCYFNVVGLPISLVYRLCRQAGYNFNAG